MIETVQDMFGGSHEGVLVQTRKAAGAGGVTKVFKDQSGKFFDQHGAPAFPSNASTNEINQYATDLASFNRSKNQTLQEPAALKPSSDNSFDAAPRENAEPIPDLTGKGFIDALYALSSGGTNVLDDLHSSYHLRLFVISMKDFQEVQTDFLNARDQKRTPTKLFEVKSTTIAESGVSTELTFGSLEMTSVIGADALNKNIGATEIKCTLVEALGCSLFDRLQLVSAKLGYGGVQDLPLFLEISFRGQYSSGHIAKKLDLPVFVQRVQLTDAQPSISLKGTEYNVTLVPLNAAAAKPDSVKIKESRRIVAKTVGEFFDQFEQGLNDTARKLSPELVDFLPEKFQKKFYVFKVPADVRAIKFDYSDKKDTAQKENGQVFQINVNQSIQAVVDAVFQKAKRSLIKLVPSSEQEELKIEKDMRLLTRIVTESFVGYLNPESNHFGVTHEFTVSFSFPNYSIHNGRPANQQKLSRKGRLELFKEYHKTMKRYSYQYTGANTDVINAELDFSNLFAVALDNPVWFSYAVNDRQSVKKPNETEQERKDRLQKQLKSDPFAVKQEMIRSGDISPDQIDSNGRIKTSASAKDQSKINSINDQIKSLDNVRSAHSSSSTESNLTYIQAIDRKKDQLNREKDQINQKYKMFSDLNESVEVQQTKINNEAKASQDSARILSDALNIFDEEFDPLLNTGFKIKRAGKPKGKVDQIGTEDQVDQSERRFQSVLEQAYNRKAAMVKMELEIRGDPYWLGSPFAGSIKDVAPVGVTEVCLFFEFKIPDKYQDGSITLADSKTIRGMYQVTTVRSTFQNGSFTQKLDCIRVPEN